MPRSSRSRSRSRDRDHSRSHHRDRDDRHRPKDRHHHRDRDSDRDRHRSRDRDRSRDREERLRRASPEARRDDRRSRSPPPADAEQHKKRARLEKLKAWKQQQQQQQAPSAPAQPPAATGQAAVPSGEQPAKPAWTPWDDPELAGAAAAGSGASAAAAPPQTSAAPATATQPAAFVPKPAVPISIAKRRAQFDMQEAEKLLKREQEGEEEDALDAFMAAEVLPEVTAAQQAERAAKEQERLERARALAEGKAPKIPKLEKILDDDSDEETPDQELQIPAHKVKLVIGAGGEKIKFIQRKSKCRLQVKKEEDELSKGFGTGPVLQGVPRGVQKTKDGEVKMVTLMLFGDAEQCQKARDMIDEAVENREQKAKQRHKEYERKREAKAAQRQLYHLRHTLDYEALGVPIGTSKAEIKSAYRKMAKIWHPDKHPDNVEEAKAKFQEIQRAYESLMTTDEDTRIEALGHK